MPDRKRTTQSLLAAIGATGAVLAGGAVGFVFLIGFVSFNAYPKASEVESSAAELSVVPLTSVAADPATSPPGDGEPFEVGPLASSVPVATGEPAGEPGLGREISGPGGQGDEPPTVVVAPPEQGEGGSSDPTTGAGTDEPLPQDPGGEDDPIVEPSPDPGGGQSGGSRPSRPLRPHKPNRPPPPATVPSTPQTGSSSGGESSEDEGSSAGGRGSRTGE